MHELNLLLVDDEQAFVETLLKRIRRRGAQAWGVASGEAALEALGRHPVDVVVLDVNMPGMSGLDTLKQIKACYPLVEVLLLTGQACVDTAIMGIEAGAFDFLMKPVDIDELIYKAQDAGECKRVLDDKKRLVPPGSCRPT